jgi:coproporphyrinogen III oxidase
MQITKKQNLASKWFEELRNLITAEFEKIEDEYFNSSQEKPAKLSFDKPGKFTRKPWQRVNEGENSDGGGGIISVMKGNVFEKVGVNISTVYGQFSPEFRKEIPGAIKNPDFYATGISLVAHMQSPFVPAIHFNTRFIVTSKEWFGGGTDLNPMYENPQDTADFHLALKNACDKHNPDYYPKFKEVCDKYFFIPHRSQARGVGGIFFDYLNNNDFEKDFAFIRNVGLAFLEIFPKLVKRHMFDPWDEKNRHHQLIRRGLYTEFNLVYDRGTRFGLMTGGNPEAVLMSLPPIAKWD